MKNTNIRLMAAGLILLSILLAGCGMKRPIPSGVATAGNYTAVLTQVSGNAGTQDLTVVVTITNRGPNARQFVGGSTSGTLAVDMLGNTLRPYSSTGVSTELITGVPVRVEIARFGPIMPGTMMLRSLRVSIGTSNTMLEFRNVPIVW